MKIAYIAHEQESNLVHLLQDKGHIVTPYDSYDSASGLITKKEDAIILKPINIHAIRSRDLSENQTATQVGVSILQDYVRRHGSKNQSTWLGVIIQQNETAMPWERYTPHVTDEEDFVKKMIDKIGQ